MGAEFHNQLTFQFETNNETRYIKLDMKKLLFATFCVVVALSANAQGTLDFNNIPSRAQVSGPDGVLGEGFTAQLQLADGTNVGDPTTFIVGPNGATGLFNGGSRTIAGVAGPGPVNLQVFVTNADGSLFGTSEIFSQPLGGHGDPPATPGALAMQSFTVVPEPSTILLAILGGGALLMLRRRK